MRLNIIKLPIIALLCMAKLLCAEEPIAGDTAQTEADELEIPMMEIDFDSFEESGSATIHPDDTISIDFPDEQVRTIIRNIAELHDQNVVIPPELSGRTSIKLRNANWRQIYEVVLAPLGYTYREDRAIIYIEPKPNPIVKGISDNLLLVLSGSLILSLLLNIFLLVRKPERA